ncbi:MAG: cytochrome b/b6 domain-containing protein [Devosiaceae bacterium]|nr:cytochrome b/b6 domain-containing protein [Devosiaceae bacterium]
MEDQKREKSASIDVWDIATRVYHWTQLVLVVSALVIGFFAPEWFLDAHIFIGYGILALIVFRLIWGFLGPEYSRFSSFFSSPGKILNHIRGVVKGDSSHSIGHNPLGGLMVFALIGVLSAMVITGIIVLGGMENQGPLAGFVGFDFGWNARTVHLVLAYGLVGMIVLHVFGVLVESKLSKTSLTRSMLNGKKELVSGGSAPKIRPARLWPALALMLGAGVGIVGGGSLASAIQPSGMIELPVMEKFVSECGDCHEVYHPSLLPRSSWEILMDELDDHFGEDASLGAETTAQITEHLKTYAAEAWDTEAANLLRAVDPQKPTQITASPFWKQNHQGIAEVVFETKPVNGEANCQACHKDALGGRFDDQQIEIAHNQTLN